MPVSTGSTETRLQAFIHALEQGRFAALIRGIVVVVVVIAVALIYLGWRFRGFSSPEAMDQAQIARQIARGHGWSTQFIRPLALWQLDANKLPLPKADFPDTFNAPLPPLVNALAVKLAGDKMEFHHGEYIAVGERMIVLVSMLCFLASIGVQYLLLRRLFDTRLAFWACSATLVSDQCWQYTLSGLPQMLMLLIFNAALYAMVRAIQLHGSLEQGGQQGAAPTVPSPRGVAPEVAKPVKVFIWMGVAGLLFGLLALSHAITIWLFVGALVYSAIYFRRRGPVVLILLLAFALVYAPWMVRNYRVSGAPLGLAGYQILDGVDGSTMQRMRSVNGSSLTANIRFYFVRPKIQQGIRNELSELSGSLGSNLVALAFFLCLVHLFRREEVNSFRWAVLTMWVLAAIGTGLAGSGGTDLSPPIGPNQIGVLFLPIMLGFGLAYVLVLFSRREGTVSLTARLVFYTMLLAVSILPLVFSMLPSNGSPFQYPPYFEPGINRLNSWTQPNEIIASDMPWAVAWYADRKSLWIPTKLNELNELNDNARLPGNLAGVFLTPISRNSPLFTGVLKGEYSDYQPLIFGRTDVPLFPFREVVPVIGDPTTYLFFSDSKRWDKEKSTP